MHLQQHLWGRPSATVAILQRARVLPALGKALQRITTMNPRIARDRPLAVAPRCSKLRLLRTHVPRAVNCRLDVRGAQQMLMHLLTATPPPGPGHRMKRSPRSPSASQIEPSTGSVGRLVLAILLCTLAFAPTALAQIGSTTTSSTMTTLPPPPPCTIDADCDDGLFCNGAETCDVVSGCQAGTPPICKDGVGCTGDGCSEALAACVNAPVDAVCDDANACNGVETCDPTLDCVGTLPPDCDDGNACTNDTCDPAAGCQSTDLPDATACSDADVCNGLETCAAGTCSPGSPLVCDDGLFCSGAETCDAVAGCEAGTIVTCNDGVGCTIDACNEATDSCDNTPDDTVCDNGLFCDGAETCAVLADCQIGTPIDCNDSVSCTVDACDDALDACVRTASDALCTNGLFCDGAELCDTIADCQAGTPINCGDGISCTVDACDESTDACSNTANDTLCDNGLFCDGIETCDPVANCMPAPSPQCNDGVGCTADACNETTNRCNNTPVDAVCDDGTVCNGLETCDALLDCVDGTPLDCADTNPCTVNACNPVTGCENPPVTEGSSCEDGNLCNGAETCQSGVCASGPPAACDDGQFCNGTETCDPAVGCLTASPVVCNDGVGCTIDACDESTDACTSSPDDSPCDNGDVCDGTETCAGVSACQPGTSLDCDDGNPCTTDSCDAAGGCTNLPVGDETSCDDGNLCNGLDTCQAGACTPGAVPECDDGIFCNGAETCDGVGGCLHGTPPDCDDGVSCTVDACDESTAA
ncbi:MAG: hypothetical protein E4H03_01415 [Myxococcales bacterium]|nr:MAG: hypothetical protein E4H03_01415 [Myxococcales bacterium]